MPTYDYECTKCGHRFEAFQSIMDAPLKKCPSCRCGKVKRLIGSGGGIIFRGTGFYCTDYKKKSGGEPPKEETSTKPSSPAATGGDSKAKPDGGGKD